MEYTAFFFFCLLQAGSRKLWGSEFDHFGCCHNTLLQANANFGENVYYADDEDVITVT